MPKDEMLHEFPESSVPVKAVTAPMKVNYHYPLGYEITKLR